MESSHKNVNVIHLSLTEFSSLVKNLSDDNFVSLKELLVVIKDNAKNKTVMKNYLYNIINEGSISKLELLLSVDSSLVNEFIDPIHGTPLLMAAYHGNRIACELLLTFGADPMRVKRGWNVLHMVAIGGKNEELISLFAHKDLLEGRSDYGNTPLLCAARCQNTSICKAILDLRPNPLVTNSGKENVFHVANAVNIHLFAPFKQHLLEARDVEGNTPLLAHSFNLISSSCKALLQLGANPFATNLKKQNVLHLANEENIYLFAHLKAHFIESKDIDGNTPLLNAARIANIGACKALLILGANPFAKNNEGKNARQVTYVKEIDALLEKKGVPNDDCCECIIS